MRLPNNVLDELLPFLGIRGKLLIAFCGLALVPAAVGALYSLERVEQLLIQETRGHLEAHLETHQQHLSGYLGLLATNSEQLGAALMQAPDPSDGGQPEVERLLHAFAQLHADYDQVRLLDLDGMELARVNRLETDLEVVGLPELQNKAARYYVGRTASLPRGEVYLSPIDRNIEFGVPQSPPRFVFRVGEKLHRPGGPPRLLVVNVFAERVMSQFSRMVEKTAVEALVVDRSGASALLSSTSGQRIRPPDELGVQLPGLDSSLLERILAGETAVMTEAGDSLLSFTPLQVGAAGVDAGWRLVLRYPITRITAPRRSLRSAFLAGGALLLVFVPLLALVASRRFTQPIHEIGAFVERVGSGDFGGRPQVQSHDEIEELACGIVAMSSALQGAQERLERYNAELHLEVERQLERNSALMDGAAEMERAVRRVDRLASLGMLTASLSHEIGNPLASLKTLVQVTQRRADSGPTADALRLIGQEIDRLVMILSRVRDLVRPAAALRATTTPRQVFDRLEQLLGRQARRERIALHLQGEAVDTAVTASGPRLDQILLNLILNAMQAIEDGGTISVTVERDGDELCLAVADTGPGFPAEALEHAFKPFFTTRSAGTGLGLPIVREAVEEMGGRIELGSSPGGGALITMHLPLQPASEPS